MRWRRAAVGFGIAVAVMAPAQQVFAHPELVDSTPAPNAVLTSGPPSIVLNFNEAVEVDLADIQLFDDNAKLVITGPPKAINGDAGVQVSVPKIGDGVYVVVWRVPSDDNHVVDGVFTFQVGVASKVDIGKLIGKVSGGVTASSTVGRLDTASRLLALIGLVVLIGGGLLALQSHGDSAGAAANLMLLWVAWAFLLAGSLGTFGFYGAKVVAGTSVDALKPSVWGKIVGSHTANVLIVRLVLIIAVGALLWTFARRAADVWRGAALALGVALILTFSAIGHAYTEKPTSVWVAIDAMHLTAISLWVGGLLMLVFGTSTWLTEPGSERIVRRFSATATIAIPVIILTGSAQTLKLAGSVFDITRTSWGRTLLVKVAVVTVLIAIGGVSRWLLRHDGPSTIKRNVVVEALIGVIVVGLAAGLVALAPRAVEASKVFSTTLTNQGVIADVTVTPGRVGPNEVHLVITPPGGAIDPVVSTNVEAELQVEGINFVPATLQDIGPNHYTGTIQLAKSGQWNLQITVAPTQGTTVVLSSVMPIPG